MVFFFFYLANLDYYKRKVSYVKVYIRWYLKGVDLRVYQLCFTEMVFYSTMVSTSILKSTSNDIACLLPLLRAATG